MFDGETTYETVERWWVTLEGTDEPAQADLAFFESDAHPWQVMLVAKIQPMTIVGACPVIGCVAERGLDDYLALGWRLRGYRKMPLESPSLIFGAPN